ncbi:DNA polymerase III subunit delta' [Roseicyclus mahoneyensis]|uniref:DNA polymerase III delta prime subunit n=1 Tax=Roseicyclus mahoneyensis TaxID=164332 RepID=A0A316GKM9_9RHOB|nr:DNA polymerase III subunit delta' [Roseicyclus mahoneyensis]PWK61196.1 DNA polymerase III delta prime subunit [Roseicyclus mahoneyensis]
MTEDALPDPDRLEGAPHPRETARIFGQTEAEATFLAALTSGRLPHGWLLTGPEGVGKATFAWRAARYLLATPPDHADSLFGAPPPPDSLDIVPEHPVAARLRALSDPGLCLIRRGPRPDGKALSDVIRVDEVRRVKSFFHMTASGDGRRVVIVDCADELNASAANALLKELEEPPRDAVLFLISHRPSGLLPTIRSRCRTLRFHSLGAEDLQAALAQAGHLVQDNAQGLAELAGGSVGEAVRLLSHDGLGLYRDLLDLLGSLPRLDRPLALRLAEATAGKTGGAQFDLTLSLLDRALARLARLGTNGIALPEIVPGEARVLARLAPSPQAGRAWADLSATLTARARRGRAVNLDPAALTFDMFLDLDRTAAQLPAA